MLMNRRHSDVQHGQPRRVHRPSELDDEMRGGFVGAERVRNLVDNGESAATDLVRHLFHMHPSTAQLFDRTCWKDSGMHGAIIVDNDAADCNGVGLGVISYHVSGDGFLDNGRRRNRENTSRKYEEAYSYRKGPR